jgi:hypothetical protein
MDPISVALFAGLSVPVAVLISILVDQILDRIEPRE